VSPKNNDHHYKNNVLKIKNLDVLINNPPNEIDPMRDPAVAASRYVDSHGVKHIDWSLITEKK
jgi:hypothetical protein